MFRLILTSYMINEGVGGLRVNNMENEISKKKKKVKNSRLGNLCTPPTYLLGKA